MFAEELGGAAFAWARLLWAAVATHPASLLPCMGFLGVSLGPVLPAPAPCYLSLHSAAAFLPAQVPMASESQSVVQQPFQQPVLVPASQSVQGGIQTGGVPIYYSVIPTAQQNGTR